MEVTCLTPMSSNTLNALHQLPAPPPKSTTELGKPTISATTGTILLAAAWLRSIEDLN